MSHPEGHTFQWTIDAESAFIILKHNFTVALILMYPDPTKPYFVQMDASDFALAVILFQEGDHHQSHPIAFHF